MKCSWYISILLVLLAPGCVSIKPLHVTRDASHDTCHVSSVTRDMSQGQPLLFKATLDIKKHHLTGLLMIKRMAPPPASPQTGRGVTFRIVFANEMGMTFFDLELKTDSFRVVSCFESLNKKSLMKIFETDFRQLTGIDPVQHEKAYRQTATGNKVFYSKAGRYKTWQTWSPSGDTLYSRAAKSTIADAVIISYFNNEKDFPSKITLDNPVIGMKISLRLLKR